MSISSEILRIKDAKNKLSQWLKSMGISVQDNELIDSMAAKLAFCAAGNEDLNKIIEKSIVDLVVPSGITKIGSYMFYSCNQMTSVTFPDTLTEIGDQSFYFCSHITKLTFPPKLKKIGSKAFCLNQGLKSPIVFPASVTNVNSYAFQTCPNVPSFTFLSKPTAIGVDAFAVTGTALKEINVPWSEGEVRNAPWGAPSVTTINYNYNVADEGTVE